MVAFALVCLVVLGAGWRDRVQGGPSSPQADTVRSHPAPKVTAGRQLYVVQCSSCHGDAKGIGKSPSYGAGAASADFYLRTGRMPLNNPRDQPIRHRPAFRTTRSASWWRTSARSTRASPFPPC